MCSAHANWWQQVCQQVCLLRRTQCGGASRVVCWLLGLRSACATCQPSSGLLLLSGTICAAQLVEVTISSKLLLALFRVCKLLGMGVDTMYPSLLCFVARYVSKLLMTCRAQKKPADENFMSEGILYGV